MPDFQSLMAAAAKADAAGDTDAARQLVAAARQAQSAGKPQAASFGNSAVDTYADFGRGVTSGLVQGSRWGQKLVAKGVSKFVDEDTGQGMLKQVQAKEAATAEQMAPYKERSPFAVGAGQLTGETLFTAPLGIGTGAGAKGLVHTGSWLATREAAKQGTVKMSAAFLAGEGAGVGAYMSGGEDMGASTAMGAGIGLGAGALINGITRGGGVVLRDRLNRGKANAVVTDALTVASKRIENASQYGGYDLNGATAMATRRSADELQRLKNNPDVGQRVIDAEANVEQQVTQRATNIAKQYGDTTNPTGYESAGRDVQVAMTRLRDVDQGNYKGLYQQMDALAGDTNTFLDTGELGSRLGRVQADNANVAKEGFMRKVDKQLQQYGIGLPEGDVPAGTKPLTLENLENLVQDLNEFWSNSLSPAKQAYLGKVKTEISTYVDETLQTLGDAAGVGSEVYKTGLAARQARASFNDKWTQGDIIEKITTRTKGGEFAVDYTKVLGKLESKDVATVKARLLGAPDGDKAWKSMQQAPLMEALAAATADTSEAVLEGGVIKFNHKAYERALNKALPTREAREVLWGKQQVDDMEKTIASWKDRYRKPDTSGSLNPSGTALTLLKQSRFLASGTGSNIGMALAGSAPVIGRGLRRGANETAVDDIIRGKKVPENIRKEMIADALDNFEKDFVGANGQRYGDLMRSIARPGAVIQIVGDE